MPDVAISPAGLPDLRMARAMPTYLVILNDKKSMPFVATKFDDSHQYYGKFVGFYCNSSVESLNADYEGLIRGTDATNFVEIMFPWSQISSIRSLVYKHKTGERK
jgi:hypothetical protein